MQTVRTMGLSGALVLVYIGTVVWQNVSRSPMYVAGTMMVLAAVVVAWQLPTQFSAAVGQRSMALIVAVLLQPVIVVALALHEGLTLTRQAGSVIGTVLIVAICLHYATRIPASVARVI